MLRLKKTKSKFIYIFTSFKPNNSNRQDFSGWPRSMKWRGASIDIELTLLKIVLSWGEYVMLPLHLNRVQRLKMEREKLISWHNTACKAWMLFDQEETSNGFSKPCFTHLTSYFIFYAHMVVTYDLFTAKMMCTHERI